jgi:uncharacterized protein (TIGR00251 family)
LVQGEGILCTLRILSIEKKEMFRTMARFKVHVQPGAKKNEVVGFQEDVLKLKLSAPPVEGRANEALVEFLAELLGVRRRQVSVVMGQKSRDKLIEVEGLESDQLSTLLQQTGR